MSEKLKLDVIGHLLSDPLPVMSFPFFFPSLVVVIWLLVGWCSQHCVAQLYHHLDKWRTAKESSASVALLSAFHSKEPLPVFEIK